MKYIFSTNSLVFIDELDEYLEPHYVCDFENGNICALEQHSNDSKAAEWKMVNSSKTPNNLMDHTFHNSSGKTSG